MAKEKIRILLIEDDPGDADLLQEILQEDSENPFIVTWVERLKDGLEQLKQFEFDLVLSDLSLPDSHGSETFTKLSTQASHLPIVVLSGSSKEEIAMQALQEGAQDYLVKGEIDHKLIVRALRYAIERKQVQLALRQSEERYILAARGANDGLWDWDLVKERVYFSPRWKQMLGYTEAEISDDIAEWFERVHPDDEPYLQEDLVAHFQGKTEHFENEHRLQHKDGSYLWILCRGFAVRNAKNEPERIAGSQTDITRRRMAEQQLKHEALHDALTGLPNRVYFVEELNIAIARTKVDEAYRFAVLFLDLDRFKIINDSLGHLVGDKLLIEVSRRLETCLRSRDTLARFGGDEFVILLNDIKGVKDAQDVADRIHYLLERPFELAEQKLFTSTSIGIALGYQQYQLPEDLLRDADTAMYEAKANGKARHVLFDTGQHKLAFSRWNLETDLHQAVAKNEMVIYYQPIVSLTSGAIVGSEALLRWQHPKHGLLSPDSFIPLAEESGLILSLGEWSIWNTCRQLQIWHQMGYPSLRVAVNVSARQLRDQNLPELIEEVLAETAVPPHCLELEMTEVSSIENNSDAIEMLEQLHKMGLRISMDDFGLDTSLHSLKRLPVDTIKIDQSFVRGTVEQDVKEVAIIRAIIAMGHSLGLNVIAEGVETEDQLLFLHGYDCNEIQGFLFSRPVAAETMTELLKNHDTFRLKLAKNSNSLKSSIHAQASQNVGYALVNNNMTILSHNAIFAQWANLDNQLLSEASILDIFPELIGIEDSIQEMIQNDSKNTIEIPRIYRQVHRSADDSFGNYFDLNVEPFQEAVATILVTVVDVTEEARLEFALRQELNELRLLMNKYREAEAKLGAIT